MHPVKRLQKQLETAVGLSELLGYAALINHQTVVMKDGALLACYRFYGDDVATSPPQMQTALALRWSDAARTFFRDGALIETHLFRKQVASYSAPQAFQDVVSALIDEERRWLCEQGGNLYETVSYVTITWLPPKPLSTQTKKFMFVGDDATAEKSPQQMMDEFEDALSQFTDFLGGAGRFSRLVGDQITTFLYQCLTGENKALAAPEQRMFLDTYLARDAFIGGFKPQIGNQHIAILALDGYPAKIHAMYLHALNTLSIPFRYQTRFHLLDQASAARQLKRQRRNWSNKAIGIRGIIREAFGSPVTPEASAVMRASELEVATAENESNELRYGFYNAQIILHRADKQQLALDAAEIKRAVQHVSFVVREETINASDAFFGALPAHGDNNARRNLFDSIAWSMLLPLSAVYAGSAICPNPLYPDQSSALLYCRTDESNIYRFNPWVGDVGHTLVLGPTGAGKSTLLELMLSQHRKYPGSRQVYLGKDLKIAGKWCILSHGGTYFDLSDDACPASMAPFAHIETDYGRALAQRWIEDVFVLNGVVINAEKRADIQARLMALAKQPNAHRVLHNMAFQNKELRRAWQTFNTGFVQKRLNATQSILGEGDCWGIDVGVILELPHAISTAILRALLDELSYAFRDGRPTMLFLDEAWLLLDHEQLRKEIKNWLKTLRKYNVSVIFASQSIADVAHSGIASTILESCPTKVWLPNPEAQTDVGANLYRGFGLNDPEIALISQATPKKHYYISQPNGKRLMDAMLGEVALAFLGVNAKSEKGALLHKHYDAKDPTWVLRYLADSDMHDAANVAGQLLKSRGDIQPGGT